MALGLWVGSWTVRSMVLGTYRFSRWWDLPRELRGEELPKEVAAQVLRDLQPHDLSFSVLEEMSKALGKSLDPYAYVLDIRDRILPALLEAVHTGQLVAFRDDFSEPPRFQPIDELAEEEPPSKRKEPDRLSMRVQTVSGETVDDSFGFVLVRPDGSTEVARLTNGCFQESPAPRADHRARFKYLHQARWLPTRVHSGGTAEMRVAARGFDAGTEVVFKVYESSHPPDAAPVGEVHATIADGEAVASWQHKPARGAPHSGKFLFEAEIKSKWISSGDLHVELYPASDLRGVKARLEQLGFEPGEPGPQSTPQLEDALKKFQQSLGFSNPNGRADANTIAVLETFFS